MEEFGFENGRLELLTAQRPRSDQIYQSFMEGYVRRINAATFNVTIGGVRIGQAKYSRLAQINLKSRIITFSRFAIENVPERGRRYLVIHELAHVKEPSHNKNFWELVRRFEPDYKKIEKELEDSFRVNVKKDKSRHCSLDILDALNGQARIKRKVVVSKMPQTEFSPPQVAESFEPDVFGDLESSFACGANELAQLQFDQLT